MIFSWLFSYLHKRCKWNCNGDHKTHLTSDTHTHTHAYWLLIVWNVDKFQIAGKRSSSSNDCSHNTYRSHVFYALRMLNFICGRKSLVCLFEKKNMFRFIALSIVRIGCMRVCVMNIMRKREPEREGWIDGLAWVRYSIGHIYIYWMCSIYTIVSCLCVYCPGPRMVDTRATIGCASDLIRGQFVYAQAHTVCVCMSVTFFYPKPASFSINLCHSSIAYFNDILSCRRG